MGQEHGARLDGWCCILWAFGTAEQARLTYLDVMRRPLLRAMFCRDVEMLDRLADEAAVVPLRVVKRDLAQELLNLLRDHGLVRTDTASEVQRYTLSAVQTGFYLSTLPGGASPGPETAARALHDTIRDALQTPLCTDPNATAAVAPTDGRDVPAVP